MEVDSSNIESITKRAVAIDASASLVIINECLNRGLKVVLPFNNFKLMWLYINSKSEPVEIRRVSTHSTSSIGVAIASDKALSYQLAEQVGMNLLPWVCVKDLGLALEFYDKLSGDCIIKPTRGQAGRDVSLSFKDGEDFLKTFSALIVTDNIILQQRALGKSDVRLLFIGGDFACATATRCTELNGDGVKSVHELVIEENSRRAISNVNRFETMYLNEIDFESALKFSGLSHEYIVPEQQKFTVSLSNSTKGGIVSDVSKIIDNSFVVEAKKMVSRLHLPVVAIDFICDEIVEGRSIEECNAYFLEANSSPGIDLHMYPHEGEGVNIAGLFIDYLANL
jgi:cyanophycin synthetase